MTSGGMTLKQAQALQSPLPEVQTRAEFERTQATMRDLEALYASDYAYDQATEVRRQREAHAATQKISD